MYEMLNRSQKIQDLFIKKSLDMGNDWASKELSQHNTVSIYLRGTNMVDRGG